MYNFCAIIYAKGGDTLKDRLKDVRLSLKDSEGKKYTQESFAAELGLAKATITAFETGNRVPANSILKLISEKFCINYNWLLTGEGDMKAPASRESEIAEITALLYNEPEDSFRSKLIRLAANMTEEQLDVLIKLVKELQ